MTSARMKRIAKNLRKDSVFIFDGKRKGGCQNSKSSIGVTYGSAHTQHPKFWEGIRKLAAPLATFYRVGARLVAPSFLVAVYQWCFVKAYCVPSD